MAVVTVYTAWSWSPCKQVKEPKTLGTRFTWHTDSVREGGQWKSLFRSVPRPAVDEQCQTDPHHLCKFLVSQRCGWAFANLTDPLRRHHGFCFYVFKGFLCVQMCVSLHIPVFPCFLFASFSPVGLFSPILVSLCFVLLFLRCLFVS